MSTVHAGQTLIADPPGALPSGQNRLVVARPIPIRAQPPAATPDHDHRSEPARDRAQAVGRQPRAGSLVIDSPFAAVPEWVIDAPITDTALRLYCVLLRYGNTTGHRMPSRATLAARLHKKSTDTIDRALRELEQLGALAVEHRATGTGRALTNRYHLLTARPGTDQAGNAGRRGGGRTDAAAHRTEEAQPPAPTPPPADRDGRTDAAPTGRTSAARVAAPIGQDRKPSTQTPPHPTPSSSGGPGDDPAESAPAGEAEARLLAACGVSDLRALIGQLHDHRRRLSRPITPWSRRRVLAALDAAVTHHGWPPDQAVRALLAIAADRHTTSPMRLTAPGPWWNTRPEVQPSGPARAPVAPRPDPQVVDRGLQLARAALRHRRPAALPS